MVQAVHSVDKWRVKAQGAAQARHRRARVPSLPPLCHRLQLWKDLSRRTPPRPHGEEGTSYRHAAAVCRAKGS